jgi:hypothetical protein
LKTAVPLLGLELYDHVRLVEVRLNMEEVIGREKTRQSGRLVKGGRRVESPAS